MELPPQMAQVPGPNAEVLTAMYNAIGKPYIEGRVYDQARWYVLSAVRLPPGTQYNTYADGVYTAKIRWDPSRCKRPIPSPPCRAAL